MAARGRLIPSSLPEEAPEELSKLRRDAVVAIERQKEAEQAARDKRHFADQAVERYEAARLEYVGQLTLFEGGKADGQQ